MNMMQGLINTHLHIISEGFSADEDRSEEDKQVFSELLEDVSNSYMQKSKIREVQMLSDIITIYEENLTKKELTELLKFYNSPVGKHLIELMPMLQKEMVAIGERNSEEITAEIAEEKKRRRKSKIRKRDEGRKKKTTAITKERCRVRTFYANPSSGKRMLV